MTGAWRVALLYTALTLALAYPLSIHPADSVLSASPDTDLFLWTLSWDVHALTHHPWSIFEANIYYPEHRTLAYSENLIGSAPLAAPVLWLTDNPVLAMNVVVLLSSVLCGVGAYLLARRIGVGACGAVLSGLIFAFSPPRFLRLDQVHLATIQWMPFSLASLQAYLDGGRKRDARLAAAFFTLQALASGHGAVFLTLAMVVLISYRVLFHRPGAFIGRFRDLGVPGALLLLPTAMTFWPYRLVQEEMGLRRSLENWIVPWSSFLASSTHVHTFLFSLLPGHINDTPGPHLFPGFVPIALGASAFRWRNRGSADRSGSGGTFWTRVACALDVAAVAGLTVGVLVSVTGVTRLKVGDIVFVTVRQTWRPWLVGGLAAAIRIAIAQRAPFQVGRQLRRGQQWLLRGSWRTDATFPYAVLTVVSLWLTLGPPVGLWQLVYWLPGLNFIRAPSRFILLAVLGVAILAGIGFDRLATHLSPRRRRLLATGVGALLIAEFAAAPLGLDSYRPNIPAADRWLATKRLPFAVAEVPVGDPGNIIDWERRETAYMLHSTAHWQKTVHGYSGFRSHFHEVLYDQLTAFPDERSLSSLIELGVNYVVVHTELYPPGEWEKVDRRIARFSERLKLEHADGQGRIYSLQQPR